ncbi:MAG: GGDEF domain-containing protein, partial [Pseudoalteromonas spongiae]
ELYRYGGEEFVLIPHVEELNGACIFAEKIRDLVASSSLFTKYQLTVSIGIAAYCANESAEQWLSRADNALYTAKNTGKNKVITSEAPIPIVQQG